MSRHQGSLENIFEQMMDGACDSFSFLEYEWIRIASFHVFPDSASVSTLRLARCGYYFIGEGSVCRCYFCGATHSDWSCKISHRPNCTQGEDHRNVPVHREEESPIINASQISGGLIIEEAPDNQFETSEIPPTDNNQQVPVSISESVRPTRRFNSYADRLRTFTVWPHQIAQRPEEMASAGFFYTGVGDRVRCAFCGGVLRDWEETDIPFHEHLRWFPHCQFIKECFRECTPPVHDSPRSEEISTAFRKVTELGFHRSDIIKAVDDLSRYDRLEDITALDIIMFFYKDDEETADFRDCDIIGPCIVCARENRCTLFFPCSHICCCRDCGDRCCVCPYCRARVKARVQAYI